MIATSAIVGFHGEGTDLSVVASDFFQLSETPVLVAIPLFTYAGFVLSAGQAPRRLVRLSQALLGWFPGGLAIVTLGVVRAVHGVHRRLGRHDHRARIAVPSGIDAGRLR